MRLRSLLLAALFSTGLAAQPGYVPERVFDSEHREFTDFEAMLAELAKADVVFVGEQHDSANTHRLELGLLEGLARRRGGVSVGLEMFERDVQEPLEHYRLGHMDEREFLAAARPWSNYRDAYKPLVDFAKGKQWPVFASNVPHSLASEVSKGGLSVLQSKSGEQTTWFARDLRCSTRGRYFDRFVEAMGGHEDEDDAKITPPDSRQKLERFYEAQCLRDETMAESIADAYAAGATAGPRPLVVHFNGAFHSDYGDGTAERTSRRLKGKRVAVVTVVPVDHLDALAPDKNERKRADFLVYTIK